MAYEIYLLCTGGAGIFGRFLWKQRSWQVPFLYPAPQEPMQTKHLLPCLFYPMLSVAFSTCSPPCTPVDLPLQAPWAGVLSGSCLFSQQTGTKLVNTVCHTPILSCGPATSYTPSARVHAKQWYKPTSVQAALTGSSTTAK